ncbi:response regulator [Planctomonas psychrotolerans]|uniref:response regulator n=1 Tax=Planctomonas psychrotolerans TaxID=2528712 RepID=UPI00123C4BA2|nr:response regulator [Planctomonas psychrotolerans]
MPALESPPSPTTRVKVLIVDDSDDQRHLLSRYFELAGCDVVVADSAESAISALDVATPDLAVVDLVLPGMDGWALTARIQSERPTCSIAITSVLDAEDYPAADAVLPKPVSRASIHRVLSTCVPGWVAP